MLHREALSAGYQYILCGDRLIGNFTNRSASLCNYSIPPSLPVHVQLDRFSGLLNAISGPYCIVLYCISLSLIAGGFPIDFWVVRWLVRLDQG
ncbi:hypothetical protein EYC80_000535 [Monilinia laxa]|uniref:Uncharacterized protein n=1 Tax=Monilinia laxa TaxID=61186 RepID=A0A5N6KB61_MONLA|nr:hypothetical protein EYC80_000535 [Monilinia laxa]